VELRAAAEEPGEIVATAARVALGRARDLSSVPLLARRVRAEAFDAPAVEAVPKFEFKEDFKRGDEDGAAAEKPKALPLERP